MRATIIISKSNYLYFNVKGETFKGSSIQLNTPFYAAYIIRNNVRHIVAASEDKDELLSMVVAEERNKFLSRL